MRRRLESALGSIYGNQQNPSGPSSPLDFLGPFLNPVFLQTKSRLHCGESIHHAYPTDMDTPVLDCACGAYNCKPQEYFCAPGEVLVQIKNIDIEPGQSTPVQIGAFWRLNGQLERVPLG